MAERPNLEKAVEVLQRADALLITAGAGMGVDSDCPTFEERTGSGKRTPLWRSWENRSSRWQTRNGSTAIRNWPGLSTDIE